MKLDATVMRTMDRQDFRVLAAVESGMKTHELVPAKLIAAISNLRHGGVSKIMSSLLRDKLLSHDKSCGYDGYRLTNSGYDILALHNLKERGLVAALGDRIGTGKESDVYVAATAEGKQVVLKFHRLGRTSFRDVKKKRDYFNVNAVNKRGNSVFKNPPNSWLFLSRISALKEFAFMKALFQVDYPTPTPLGHNRHIVVMGLVRGVPLFQMRTSRVSPHQAESIFQQSTILASRLAAHGLVHCDLNEFNLMVDLSGIQDAIANDNDVAEHYVRHSGMSVTSQGALSAHGPIQKHGMDGTGEIITEAPPEPKAFLENGEPTPIVTLIDFPQMVSTRHPNGKELYERDLACLKRFFCKKLKCVPEEGWDDLIPKWEDVIGSQEQPVDDAANDDNESASCNVATKAQLRLDEELQASGYSENDATRDMELYYFNHDPAHGLPQIDDDEEEEDDDEEDEREEAKQEQQHDVEVNVPDIDDDKAGSSIGSDDDAGARVDLSLLLDEDQMTVVTQQSRAMAEEKAKIRVRQHLEERKKKGGRKGAFRSRNSNKTFVKGKRVFEDFGI